MYSSIDRYVRCSKNVDFPQSCGLPYRSSNHSEYHNGGEMNRSTQQSSPERQMLHLAASLVFLHVHQQYL
ncbi:hypothetical protein Mapa_013910 [Marchantia paleacea]|nr:hypothetical protein Mapa_013910 [Marchantia paleacea]